MRHPTKTTAARNRPTCSIAAGDQIVRVSGITPIMPCRKWPDVASNNGAVAERPNHTAVAVIVARNSGKSMAMPFARLLGEEDGDHGRQRDAQSPVRYASDGVQHGQSDHCHRRRGHGRSRHHIAERRRLGQRGVSTMISVICIVNAAASTSPGSRRPSPSEAQRPAPKQRRRAQSEERRWP